MFMITVRTFIHSFNLSFIPPSIAAVGAKRHGWTECSPSRSEHSFIHSIFHSFLPPFQRSVLNCTDGENVHGHGQNIIVFNISTSAEPDVNIALSAVHAASYVARSTRCTFCTLVAPVHTQVKVCSHVTDFSPFYYNGPFLFNIVSMVTG